MKPASPAPRPRPFRVRFLLAMMLVVAALTALGLFLADRKVAVEAARDLEQDFRNELATLHGVREVRQAALVERCRRLTQRPRIHAALEDNALDLLYPSARDELRDLISTANGSLHARFYRFLDRAGAVLPPPPGAEVGQLAPGEAARIAVQPLPAEPQSGYLLRESAGDRSEAEEILAVPIFSSESGEVISAIVLGFRPETLSEERARLASGIWAEGKLDLPRLAPEASPALLRALESQAKTSSGSFRLAIAGEPHLIFFKQLNPGSIFPAAYEVALYPLHDALARQRQLRRHVLWAGGGLLLVGLLASHFLAGRLAKPVETLAVASREERTRRREAEAALEATSEELQRTARFSADASHQLKTPVTVLRAGIDELLARDDLPPDLYHELSALLHQTYRITSVVDDLLLLSRMDAGQLRIQFEPVNLSQLLEEWIDDLGAVPDELHVKLETDFPPGLHVAGEKRYITLIVQNLLENARKYNQQDGHICVWARDEGEFVILGVENTGKPIPRAAQPHIFERFHRGVVGENVPGHGLGLNLARELARLQGGDLCLTRSDEEATEFEVRFRAASRPAKERALSEVG